MRSRRLARGLAPAVAIVALTAVGGAAAQQAPPAPAAAPAPTAPAPSAPAPTSPAPSAPAPGKAPAAPLAEGLSGAARADYELGKTLFRNGDFAIAFLKFERA